MPGFIVRLLITAVGFWIADALLPGVSFSSVGAMLWAAFLMGLVNAIVRPLMIIFTFPITVLTLGLFLLVVNAAMFGLVAAMMDGFRVAGFFSAVFGSLIVTATGWVASQYIGPRGSFEVMVVRQDSTPSP